MKLLGKLTNRYISWSLLVMVISGIVIYFTLSIIINRQMDERLVENLQTIEKQLNQTPETVFFALDAKVHKTTKAPESITFSDTLIFNEIEQEFEEYRQMYAVKNIGGNYFRIVLRKSKIESEDFLATLAAVTLLGMILLWVILLMVTRQIAKSIWKPFYENLEIIQQFSLSGDKPITLNKTGILEFEQLNGVLEKLTEKIITDFRSQKQFSEDVSHELQTPLAVISSRLESLLGNPGLMEHSEVLNSIYASVRRLSKLNRELILFSKIENNQFASEEESNLKSIVTEKLDEFSELIALKKLTLETEINDDFIVSIPPVLAEILVNNLLSNSINHNFSGGKVRIEINAEKLSVCNTGSEMIAEPEKLFNRFYKANPASQSVGLGLAIAKKICDLHGLKIEYSFNNGYHFFNISTDN